AEPTTRSSSESPTSKIGIAIVWIAYGASCGTRFSVVSIDARPFCSGQGYGRGPEPPADRVPIGRGLHRRAGHEVLDPEVLPRIVAADLELGRAVGVEGILAARRVCTLAEQAPRRVVPNVLIVQPHPLVIQRQATVEFCLHLSHDTHH